MFNGAIAFNQPISNWNVSKDTTMLRMFQTANAFNQNIGSWAVDSVTNMSGMFKSAIAFNQNISGWHVVKVKTMDFMFNHANSFNQPIGTWNVSNVTNMNSMFYNAHVFNQQLSSWNLISVTNVTDMFRNSALSCSNYSNTLIGWAANANTPNGLSLTNNTLFAGGAITYSTDGQTARNTLINTKSWIINGDSYDASCVTTSLQVKLSTFNAYKQNDKVLLQWAYRI
jgi:surface protein